MIDESPAIDESPNPTGASQAPSLDEGDSSKRKLTSPVWNHFKRQQIDGKWKAICNYYNGKLLGELKQGTSHLSSHFKTCKYRRTRDIRQSFLKTSASVTGETVVVDNYSFDQETVRQSLAKMIILHEYPISIVEHIGFKQFCNAMQPLFKMISHNTVKSDILNIYDGER
ncbi:zinc finger BED domain-containing protein RICESLEEPER 3-like [Canna indica]|uniref:Zinc finger BED domain-containing protein RICESLEEPER 3-like n=1 Tax=Canna indica TaxID=4628 RepID=A0AAQ3KQV2_9LILI|nr:zinc finger BED domain-containing protein RICESLEEPER 3-like [Canna indica]